MFTITITETKTLKRLVNGDWQIIGTKEVERDKMFWEQRTETKTRIEEVYGYTPAVEKVVEETTTLLTQEVQTLDLAKVIKAINNL